MSFAKRKISITLTVNTNADKTAQPKTANLEGLRCEVNVQNPGGILNQTAATVRVFGMSMADMNAFATNGRNALAIRSDAMQISAGDVDGKMSKIFEGTILSAYIDFNGVPDVAFVIVARAAMIHQLMPTAVNSYKGTVKVADIVKSIADATGHAFVNNGVTDTVTDMYLPSTSIDQLRRVVFATRIGCSIDNGKITIWPNGNFRDNESVKIGPDTGMIGYPFYIPTGLKLRSLFNADIVNGKKITVDSVMQQAKGDWICVSATHDLSTLHPSGTWFTDMTVSLENLYVANI